MTPGGRRSRLDRPNAPGRRTAAVLATNRVLVEEVHLARHGGGRPRDVEHDPVGLAQREDRERLPPGQPDAVRRHGLEVARRARPSSRWAARRPPAPARSSFPAASCAWAGSRRTLRKACPAIRTGPPGGVLGQVTRRTTPAGRRADRRGSRRRPGRTPCGGPRGSRPASASVTAAAGAPAAVPTVGTAAGRRTRDQDRSQTTDDLHGGTSLAVPCSVPPLSRGRTAEVSAEGPRAAGSAALLGDGVAAVDHDTLPGDVRRGGDPRKATTAATSSGRSVARSVVAATITAAPIPARRCAVAMPMPVGASGAGDERHPPGQLERCRGGRAHESPPSPVAVPRHDVVTRWTVNSLADQ